MMMEMTKRTFLKAAVSGAAVLPGMAAADGLPRRHAGATHFPDVWLQTHDGKRVRFYTDLVQGRRVVLNTMYSVCTNICPPATINLLGVQKNLGRRVGEDIFMYSITLQPETDTPGVLQAYARKYGVGPGWIFLTGKRGDIELVRRSLGFYDADPEVDKDLAQHTGMLRIGNDALDRWMMLPAASPPRLIVRNILRF